MKPVVAVKIAIAAALIAAIAACVVFLPDQSNVDCLLYWIETSGASGLILFVALYVVICLILLPGSILTLAGGFMFGIAKGIAVSSLGFVLGAAAAYAVSRVIGRKWIEGILAVHPRFFTVDRAIGKQSFKVVLLIRLCSFFPTGLSSYMFGLTKVSPGKFVLATWIGKLPGIVVWTYLGSNAKSLADLVAGKIQVGIWEQVFLWVGLAAMAAAAVYIAEIARRALNETLNGAEK